MKIKITRAQLDEIINEEVQKYNRIKELEQRKEQLSEVLRRLDEGENLDELLGGLGNLAKAGLRKSWNGLKSVGKGALAIGNDMAQAADNIGKGVGNAYHDVKQTYQQGEANQAAIDAQKNLDKIYAQKRALDQKIQALQAKHKELTGQLYQPTRLNYKAPSANPINYQRNKTAPVANINPDQSAAAE